jgi:hypothetical protein
MKSYHAKLQHEGHQLNMSEAGRQECGLANAKEVKL